MLRYSPAKSIGMDSAPACKADPRVKIATARMMEPLRPIRSAMGPFTSDPNQAASSKVDVNQPLNVVSM